MGSRAWILRRILLVLALAGAVALTRCGGVALDQTGTDRPVDPTTTTLPETTGVPSGPDSSTVPADAGSTPGAGSDPSATATEAFEQLQGLRVGDPDPDLQPYRRDAFGDGWDYDPESGCNIRERVLIEEAAQAPVVDDRCRSTEGRWVSLYDGVEVDSVAELQIDHLIPLAEAWRTGASDWTQERREAFANDLTHPDTLIAVTGFTNQSKGDSSPDRWMPPDIDAWCTYAEMWVGVKARWDLSVTESEQSALAAVLTSC